MRKSINCLESIGKYAKYQENVEKVWESVLKAKKVWGSLPKPD